MRMSSQDQYKQGSGEGSGLRRGRFWAVIQSQEPQPTARWGVGESGTQMAFRIVLSWDKGAGPSYLCISLYWMQAVPGRGVTPGKATHFSQENSQQGRPLHSASLIREMESYSSSLGNTPQVLYKRPRERKESRGVY